MKTVAFEMCSAIYLSIPATPALYFASLVYTSHGYLLDAKISKSDAFDLRRIYKSLSIFTMNASQILYEFLRSNFGPPFLSPPFSIS